MVAEQLLPMASARAETFFTIPRRKLMTSSTTKMAQASNKATALVSMMISICLRLIDV